MLTIRFRRAARPVVLFAAALSLLAAGCGGSSSGAGTGAADTSGSGGSPAQGSSGATGDSKAVVVQGVDPTTMDPLQQRETTTVNVLQHFYDPLIDRDGKDPKKFDPVLATSWKRVNDTTLRFKLRSGVKFDDGSTFDAADVKYTVDALLGKLPGRDPAILSYQYGTLKGAKVVDAHTVDIITKGPDPLLYSRMAALMIIPKGSVDKDPKALAAKPDGTGPYQLVEWDRNNQVVMKAKPDYYRGAPAIDQVIFKTMPEASSSLAALEAGQVDLVTNVPADNIQDVESSGNASVESVNSARIASVWLNMLDTPALKKPEVRQALNYAVDVDTIVKQVMSGYGLPVATFVPPYFEDYDASVKPLGYDPAKAKQLLAQAGYPNGFSMTIMVPQGRYEFASEVSQAVAGYLGKVGVKVKLDTVDFGVFAKATQERKIPAAFYGAWGEDYFNPIDEMDVAVKSGTTGFSWYDNPQVDALIDKAGSTLDPGKQTQLVTQIQQKLLQDPPFIFLFAYKDLYGVSKRLDFTPRSDESINMYEAKLK
jgi:peptide/nickel transport system substrate-binding protein